MCNIICIKWYLYKYNNNYIFYSYLYRCNYIMSFKGVHKLYGTRDRYTFEQNEFLI